VNGDDLAARCFHVAGEIPCVVGIATLRQAQGDSAACQAVPLWRDEALWLSSGIFWLMPGQFGLCQMHDLAGSAFSHIALHQAHAQPLATVNCFYHAIQVHDAKVATPWRGEKDRKDL